jgi:hypothetical protein
MGCWLDIGERGCWLDIGERGCRSMTTTVLRGLRYFRVHSESSLICLISL